MVVCGFWWISRMVFWVWVWCAGRNPPFVHRQHSAIRATRASCSSSWAPICPYTLQDSRFTVSHPASFNNLACIIVNCLDGRFVSVLLPKLSPCTLSDAAILRGGRSFLKL